MPAAAQRGDWSGTLVEAPARTSTVLLLLAASVLLLATALRNPVAFDAFWHLRMGLDWLREGLLPWRDHLSFTYAGETISSPPYLFEALLAGLIQPLGLYGGFVAYKLLAFGLVLAGLAVYLTATRAPLLAWVVVLPLAVVLLQLRATVRPELLSYGLSIAAMALYRRVDVSLTWRQVVPIAALLLVWVNWHVAIIGYVVFCGLFVELAVRQLQTRAAPAWWTRWALWGALLLVVGFLHPGLAHPLPRALGFSAEWKNLIQEYEPASLYVGLPGAWAMLLATVLAGVLALLQRRWGYLLILAVLVPNALATARLVTPAGLVVLCILADGLGAAARVGLRPAMIRVGAALVLACAAGGFYSAVDLARAIILENRSNTRVFPRALADHMVAAGFSGRIFNDYAIGGYLAYRLAPQGRVYIDGRTGMLYPVAHYQRYQQALNDATVLAEEIERWDIDALVLEDSDANHRRVGDLGGFGLDFAGPRFALFLPGERAFAHSGTLRARPACWDAQIASHVRAERDEAVRELPAGAPHRAFIELAAAYAEAPDAASWLSAISAEDLPTDALRRFVGYRALDQERPRLALDAFMRVQSPEAADPLAAATAALALDDLRSADAILTTATRIDWPRLTWVDLATLRTLAVKLREREALTAVGDDFVGQIEAQLTQAGIAIHDWPLDTTTFCAQREWELRGPPSPKVEAR